MGWVTLTLRKTELKRTHADYQMELLEISRTKRQMARQNHYDQLVARNEGQNATNSLYAEYTAARDAATQQMQGATTTNADGSKTTDQAALAAAQQALNAAKEDYEMKKMNAQNDMEEELARIEQEANDTETMLDQEQVEVEAQLEAISAEMEAVGEAVSSQIQSSTIKLS
ncbi:MAG: hypothetical protein E7Z88_07870 [Cyanobacteria bacterium SIG27]|nr:hypothetical protein [Cyanobacteria bacterium SIG27]MBQ9150310.1 hypothetical protein [bacterium]